MKKLLFSLFPLFLVFITPGYIRVESALVTLPVAIYIDDNELDSFYPESMTFIESESNADAILYTKTTRAPSLPFFSHAFEPHFASYSLIRLTLIDTKTRCVLASAVYHRLPFTARHSSAVVKQLCQALQGKPYHMFLFSEFWPHAVISLYIPYACLILIVVVRRYCLKQPVAKPSVSMLTE